MSVNRVSISISALSSEPAETHKRMAVNLLTAVNGLLDEENCIPTYYIGGYAGLMKQAIDTILDHNNRRRRSSAIVAILPIEYEDTELPADVIPVFTGMSFQNRNPILVRSGDFLLSLGGGAGTIMEIYNAVALGKNVLLLVNTGTPSDYLYSSFPDGVIDPKREGRVTYIDVYDSSATDRIRGFLRNECSKKKPLPVK